MALRVLYGRGSRRHSTRDVLLARLAANRVLLAVLLGLLLVSAVAAAVLVALSAAVRVRGAGGAVECGQVRREPVALGGVPLDDIVVRSIVADTIAS